MDMICTADTGYYALSALLGLVPEPFVARVGQPLHILAELGVPREIVNELYEAAKDALERRCPVATVAVWLFVYCCAGERGAQIGSALPVSMQQPLRAAGAAMFPRLLAVTPSTAPLAGELSASTLEDLVFTALTRATLHSEEAAVALCSVTRAL